MKYFVAGNLARGSDILIIHNGSGDIEIELILATYTYAEFGAIFIWNSAIILIVWPMVP